MLSKIPNKSFYMYRDLVKSFKFFNVMSDVAYNNPIYNKKNLK